MPFILSTASRVRSAPPVALTCPEDFFFRTVRAAFALPAALRADLVAMSPLHWGQAAMEPNAAGLASLSTVTLAVELLIAEKSAGNY